MKLLVSLVLVVVVGLISFANAAQITTIPDYIGPELSMYTGYVTVDQTSHRSLFYWLVESQGNPSTDPLVVWYQGGPGCSSLGGLFTENGPFTPLVNGSIGYTNLAWTQFANMLYVEAPAGVGFSYSDNPNDYRTNDNKTAADNYLFLQGFLSEYPQYANRDLWIAGESYAGVYLPTLAENILSNPSTSLFQQFKGIMAGNPVFDCPTEIENAYTIQFNLLYYHGLVSFEHFSNWTSKGCNSKKNPGVCALIYSAAVNEIGIIDQQLVITNPQVEREPSLDPDDLYQDFCTGNGTLEFVKDDPKACKNTNSGSLLTTYLNRKDVQQAIGAQPANWAICSNKISYQTSGASMVNYYEDFFVQKPGLNILIYSGDIDIMTVPFATTQPCLAELNRPIVSDWQPWFVNGWTGGYVQVFDTYTFATIKGAGHEAPGYQPLIALNMFQRFLTTQSLNSPAEIQQRETKSWNEIAENKPIRQSDMLKFHGVKA